VYTIHRLTCARMLGWQQYCVTARKRITGRVAPCSADDLSVMSKNNSEPQTTLIFGVQWS
jgi:hypothetical protein